MVRRLLTFILCLSFSHAHNKLDPGYEIPGHVQFILRTYQAIEREDATLINPEAFDRVDLHHSLTLFFDPNWGDKIIPTTLKGLETHYGKVRKILKYPYWAHLRCLEVLEGFDRRSYLTKEHILEEVPVTLTDALKGEDITHVDHLNILMDLSNAKTKKSPTYSDSRQLIPLNVALPKEIENPLFLMTLARSLQYFPCTMLTVMEQFNTGEIEEDKFAQTLKAHMMDKKDSEPFSQFEYIMWYIHHYNVFGE